MDCYKRLAVILAVKYDSLCGQIWYLSIHSVICNDDDRWRNNIDTWESFAYFLELTHLNTDSLTAA